MKPTRKIRTARLKENGAQILFKLSTALKAQLEKESYARGISMSELIRRRCQRQDPPPPTDTGERLHLYALNIIERISRDVRRTEPITEQHVRLVEALYALATQLGAGGGII